VLVMIRVRVFSAIYGGIRRVKWRHWGAAAAFPSNVRSFLRRRQYTINGQNAIRADRCARTLRAIAHTRPRPVLSPFDEARSHGVEVPVIRQEDPGGKQKVMFFSSFPYHAGQALEFGFLEPPPVGSSRQVMKKNRSDNTRRCKRDMKQSCTPVSIRTSRRVSGERDSALQGRNFLFS
jgi:hypothetical protein